MTSNPFPKRLRTPDDLRQIADDLRRDGYDQVADNYLNRMADAQDTIAAVSDLGLDVHNAWQAENERSIHEEVGMDMTPIGRDMYARLVDAGWVPPIHLYRPEKERVSPLQAVARMEERAAPKYDQVADATFTEQDDDALPMGGVAHHPRCDGTHVDGPCRRVVDPDPAFTEQTARLCMAFTTTGPCVLAEGHGLGGSGGSRGGSGGHLSQVGVDRWKYVGQNTQCTELTKTGPCMLEHDHLGGHHSQTMIDLVADAESKGLI